MFKKKSMCSEVKNKMRSLNNKKKSMHCEVKNKMRSLQNLNNQVQESFSKTAANIHHGSRYAGKIISRSESVNQWEDNSIDESLSELSDENQMISKEESITASEDEDGVSSKSDEDFDSDEEKPGIKIISDRDCSSEIEKGKCVINQLKRIDALLKLRIELQKHLIFSNQLPQFDAHETFMSNPTFKARNDLAVSNYSTVLDKLLELQDHFLETHPETRSIVLKSRENTENKASSTRKRKLDDYEKLIDHNHKIFAKYRDSVIQKFDDKTRFSSGKLNKDLQERPVLQQIEFVLSNREKLLKRTRLKRLNYKIAGKPSAKKMDQDGRHVQECDPEVFDDTDFYQQLLRDEIVTKTREDEDQVSKSKAQLERMRSKMKRNLDTRATKGRRIRYVVHPKLVNFMALITHNDNWSDSAKDELFNSLFGKSVNQSTIK